MGFPYAEPRQTCDSDFGNSVPVEFFGRSHLGSSQNQLVKGSHEYLSDIDDSHLGDLRVILTYSQALSGSRLCATRCPANSHMWALSESCLQAHLNSVTVDAFIECKGAGSECTKHAGSNPAEFQPHTLKEEPTEPRQFLESSHTEDYWRGADWSRKPACCGNCSAEREEAKARNSKATNATPEFSRQLKETDTDFFEVPKSVFKSVFETLLLAADKEQKWMLERNCKTGMRANQSREMLDQNAQRRELRGQDDPKDEPISLAKERLQIEHERWPFISADVDSTEEVLVSDFQDATRSNIPAVLIDDNSQLKRHDSVLDFSPSRVPSACSDTTRPQLSGRIVSKDSKAFSASHTKMKETAENEQCNAELRGKSVQNSEKSKAGESSETIYLHLHTPSELTAPDSGDGSNGEFGTQFRVAENPREFFRRGRVFCTIVTIARGRLRPESAQRSPRSVRREEQQFIVLRTRSTFCLCLPISTYEGKGTTKPGVRAQDHAAIVVEGELVRWATGEHLEKSSLEVALDKGGPGIEPYSRINFAELHTFEYRWVAKSVGHVTRDSLRLMEDYWSSVQGFGLES